MFSWCSLKENGELTERFPILENGRLIQGLTGIHRLGKLTVNEGFLAVIVKKATCLMTIAQYNHSNKSHT